MLLHKCRLIGLGLGFDDIEKVAGMDEHVRFLLNDLIYRFKKRWIIRVIQSNYRFSFSSKSHFQRGMHAIFPSFAS